MNPRSPFVLDTRELGRTPGDLREYRREAEAPSQLGLDMIGVPEGAPLVVNVRIQSVSEGVLATGSVSATVEGVCGRCLIEFAEALDVDFVELFAYPDSTTEETTDSDEIPRLEGVHLDLESMVRDAVVLSLPLTPLCRPDCAGLCSECGERLEDLPGNHSHVQLDPRWAALAGRLSSTEGSAGQDAENEDAENTVAIAPHTQSQE